MYLFIYIMYLQKNYEIETNLRNKKINNCYIDYIITTKIIGI